MPGKEYHIFDPRKSLIQQKNQSIPQLNAGFLCPLMQPALHFEHLSALILVGKIAQFHPKGKPIIGDFKGIGSWQKTTPYWVRS